MASVVRLCITHVAFRAAVVREATAAASGARGRRRRVRSVDHNLMFVMHRAKVENCSFARGSSSHFVAAAAAPADGIPHIYSVGHSESARDGCRAVQDASEWRTVHDRALQCATAGGARCKKMVPTPRYTLNTLRTRTPTPPPADSRVRATRLQLSGRSATLAARDRRRPAAARSCADPTRSRARTERASGARCLVHAVPGREEAGSRWRRCPPGKAAGRSHSSGASLLLALVLSDTRMNACARGGQQRSNCGECWRKEAGCSSPTPWGRPS